MAARKQPRARNHAVLLTGAHAVGVEEPGRIRALQKARELSDGDRARRGRRGWRSSPSRAALPRRRTPIGGARGLFARSRDGHLGQVRAARQGGCGGFTPNPSRTNHPRTSPCQDSTESGGTGHPTSPRSRAGATRRKLRADVASDLQSEALDSARRGLRTRPTARRSGARRGAHDARRRRGVVRRGGVPRSGSRGDGRAARRRRRRLRRGARAPDCRIAARPRVGVPDSRARAE